MASNIGLVVQPGEHPPSTLRGVSCGTTYKSDNAEGGGDLNPPALRNLAMEPIALAARLAAELKWR